MIELIPPRFTIRVALADDGWKRFWLRLRQLAFTFLTVLITAWFVAMGPIPAILALVVAKHVLVAILVMGLGVDAPRTSRA